MFRSPQQLVVVLIGLSLAGCGTKPAPEKPVSDTILIPTTSADETVKPATRASLPAARDATFADSEFLSDDVVGLLTVRPRRLAESPLFRTLQDAGLQKDIDEQLDRFHLKVETIDRATLVFDQATVNKSARLAGIDLPDAKPGEQASVRTRNQLKQLGLAFLNYHDIYGMFPRANGDGMGKVSGLSWRVHLLPLLEEGELYEQFHLDEPWDSEHNKTLIEKMPPVFQTPGVTETGKSSLHVFVGDNTPFHGEMGTALKDIPDGPHNTIMAVIAGADAADVWTKPGGLAFNPEDPKPAFGNIGEKAHVLLADGSVESLAMELGNVEIANLINVSDGNTVTIKRSEEAQPLVPTVIVSFASKIDQAEFLSVLFGAEPETYRDQTLVVTDSFAVCFFDEKTLLLGRPDAVRKMIDTRKANQPVRSEILEQLDPAADLALVMDVKSQGLLLEQASMLNPVLVGVVQQIHSVTTHLNLTVPKGDKLFELTVTATTDQMAELLTGQATGTLDQAKAILVTGQPTSEEDAPLYDFATRVMQSAKIRRNGDRIEFVVPMPSDFDQLPEYLAPRLKKRDQGEADF